MSMKRDSTRTSNSNIKTKTAPTHVTCDDVDDIIELANYPSEVEFSDSNKSLRCMENKSFGYNITKPFVDEKDIERKSIGALAFDKITQKKVNKYLKYDEETTHKKLW